MRGCPAGYMFHRFDKTTHRCRCGRYQPGFAPKKDFVKPRQECQICEQLHACDKDGTVGHHGYKRPGWGFINGDCMGEGFKPYPAIDALEKYLSQLENYLLTSQNELSELPIKEAIIYTYGTGFGDKRTDVSTTVHRGDSYRWENNCRIPSFLQLLDRLQKEIILKIDQVTKEKERVQTRIKKAKGL